jgi:Arc/MetJ family transcription regulator
VDEELLTQARVILGADTKKDTVNGALREVVRRWSVTEFGALARSGVFEELRVALDKAIASELVVPCP